MKAKNILVLSCCLVMAVVLACSFIDNLGGQMQPTRTPDQEGGEVPDSPTLAVESGDASPEAVETLPAGGCPENLGKIVFSSDDRDRGGSVHYGIYLMDPDGSNRIRLSSLEEIHHNQPAWSPERCRIAFRSYTHDGDDDIYVMTADGKSIRRLTTDPARDMFPDWSPDGTQIVFVSYRNGGIPNLFVMDADGSHQRQLTTNPEGHSYWEQWSPIGDEIAFIYEADNPAGNIFIINSDGSGLRQLTPDAGEVGDLDLTWSPDGQKIYFVSNRSHYLEIWEINLDGSGLRQITNLRDVVDISHSLRVSPNGKQLAVYGVGMDVGQHAQEIYVINVDGSGLKDITNSPGSEEWLDW